MRRTKTEILKDCEYKDPTLFIQHDGFSSLKHCGSLATPDDEGHVFVRGITYELMSELLPNVTVLITPDTPKETALKLLDKIKREIKENENWRQLAVEELKKKKKLEEKEYQLHQIFVDCTSDESEYLHESIEDIKNPLRI
jgi:hypothetical protein